MWPKWILSHGFKYPDENIVRFIAKNYKDVNARKNLKVLDAGFASGRHIIFFGKEGFDVYGIDFEEEAVKFINEWLKFENMKANTQKGDILQIPFSDDYFDIVVDHGMIEHFSEENRKKAFKEITRVLKKGGVFIYVAKSSDDYYYKKGKETEKDTFILNTYFIEDMPFHFYKKDDLLNELNPFFSKIDLECLEQHRENLTIKLSTWYVYCYK